jgi:hypothetical protein
MLPFIHGSGYHFDHFMGQSIQRFGAVEMDQTGMTLLFTDYFGLRGTAMGHGISLNWTNLTQVIDFAVHLPDCLRRATLVHPAFAGG